VDYTPYVLASIGAIVAALVTMAYNKPRDYLEIIYPIMKVLNLLFAGAMIGTLVGVTAACSYLTPLVESIKGGPTALASARNISYIALLVFFAFSVFDFVMWYFATTMRIRNTPTP
jgi:hypothetical protein